MTKTGMKAMKRPGHRGRHWADESSWNVSDNELVATECAGYGYVDHHPWRGRRQGARSGGIETDLVLSRTAEYYFNLKFKILDAASRQSGARSNGPSKIIKNYHFRTLIYSTDIRAPISRQKAPHREFSPVT